MDKEFRFDDIYFKYSIDKSPEAKDFNMHIHNQCEIYLFISGNVEYLVEGSKYPLTKNSIMIMSPAEAHTPRIKSPIEYERYMINFPLDLVKAIDDKGILTRAFTERKLGQNNMYTENEVDTELIVNFFTRICSDIDEYERRVLVRAYLPVILDAIGKGFKNRKNKTKGLTMAEKIVAYVNKHLFEDITVESLAGHFYLSNSQFSRLFIYATGIAPWSYILKKRVITAKEKITQGTPINKAAEICGFKDYSVFYRAYVNHFGHSPSEDKKNNPG